MIPAAFATALFIALVAWGAIGTVRDIVGDRGRP